MIGRTLVCALLVGCAGKAVSIGSNPAGRDVAVGGGPSIAGTTGMVGGGAAVTGGVANGASGGVAVGEGGVGGSSDAPMIGCAQQIASGDAHFCVMYDDGKVACLGDNTYGQLGQPIGSSSASLWTIPGANATLLAAGGGHNCIVSPDGVECWGDNGVHQLGAVTSASVSPTPVLSLAKGIGGATLQIVAGRHFTCTLDSLLHGICWGLFGSGASYAVPQAVSKVGLEPGQFLVAGAGLLRLVQSDRLFDVHIPMPSEVEVDPTAVRGATAGVTTNAIGTDHECILKRSGTVWCRGTGFFDFYTAVTELGTDVVEVKVGYGFTCVRSQIGEVRCLGASELGQLGSLPLPKTGRSVIAVPIATGAVELSLGLSHACALMQDGSVRCWGSFGERAFGARPTTVSQPDPKVVCYPKTQGYGLDIEPSSRPADEYADSALAWVHESCRISGKPFETCVREEAVVLNGCLQSIAATDQDYSTCAGERYWDAADCAAASDGGISNLTRCAPHLDVCGSPSAIVQSCAQGQMLCHLNADDQTRVTADQVCDGRADCANGFDEANCAPDSDVFFCASGSKIPLDSLTKGDIVCDDGSNP